MNATEKRMAKRFDKKYSFGELSHDDVISMINELDDNNLVMFNVEQGCTESDYWLNCFYYSKALNKTILWDCDWYADFDNATHFMEMVHRENYNITAFEARITLAEGKK